MSERFGLRSESRPQAQPMGPSLPHCSPASLEHVLACCFSANFRSVDPVIGFIRSLLVQSCCLPLLRPESAVLMTQAVGIVQRHRSRASRMPARTRVARSTPPANQSVPPSSGTRMAGRRTASRRGVTLCRERPVSPQRADQNPGGAIRATREPVRAPVIGRTDGRSAHPETRRHCDRSTLLARDAQVGAPRRTSARSAPTPSPVGSGGVSSQVPLNERRSTTSN